MNCLRLFLITFSLIGLLGCSPGSNTSSSAPKADSKAWFPMTIGDQQIRVQLAIEPEEQQYGLMYRQQLAENDGMLFIFPRPESRGFWMRNVDLPLDVGYINPDGVLREIYPMYPHNENSVKSMGSDIQLVLEMNQGWFKKHKVFAGAKIDLAQVVSAMKERGYKPAKFGLPEN